MSEPTKALTQAPSTNPDINKGSTPVSAAAAVTTPPTFRFENHPDYPNASLVYATARQTEIIAALSAAFIVLPNALKLLICSYEGTDVDEARKLQEKFEAGAVKRINRVCFLAPSSLALLWFSSGASRHRSRSLLRHSPDDS